MSEPTQTTREAVAVFDDSDTMQAAIDELLSAGFAQGELSLLAGDDAVREKLGHAYHRVEAAADDPEAPRTVYVEPGSRGDAKGGLIGGLMYVGALAAAGIIVASGGTAAAAIGAAVAAGAGGGALGGALAWKLDEQHSQYISDQLRRGGLLLWVSVRDPSHEQRAVEILRRHSAGDVHVHDIRN